jgi:hypothetical protein
VKMLERERKLIGSHFEVGAVHLDSNAAIGGVLVDAGVVSRRMRKRCAFFANRVVLFLGLLLGFS